MLIFAHDLGVQPKLYLPLLACIAIDGGYGRRLAVADVCRRVNLNCHTQGRNADQQRGLFFDFCRTCATPYAHCRSKYNLQLFDNQVVFIRQAE